MEETPPKVPFPDASEPPQIPAEFRLPLQGKMSSPTVTPASAQERMTAIREKEKGRRRRSFLLGLLVGQALIVLMNFGGEIFIHLMRHRMQFRAPVPLRSLVFMGMSLGILATGLFIFFVLGLQGSGYVLGKKKIGFLTAVGRGMRRVGRAAGALGLTLSVIGGTAWFMIPAADWKPTADYIQAQGEKALDGARKLVKPSKP